MSTLPNSVSNADLLKWVAANPDKGFEPNMLISATHTTDWQWQAVDDQMKELKRQNYITMLKQDATGLTYWTITQKGQNYLRALQSAEKTIEEDARGDASPRRFRWRL